MRKAFFLGLSLLGALSCAPRVPPDISHLVKDLQKTQSEEIRIDLRQYSYTDSGEVVMGVAYKETCACEGKVMTAEYIDRGYFQGREWGDPEMVTEEGDTISVLYVGTDGTFVPPNSSPGLEDQLFLSVESDTTEVEIIDSGADGFRQDIGCWSYNDLGPSIDGFYSTSDAVNAVVRLPQEKWWNDLYKERQETRACQMDPAELARVNAVYLGLVKQFNACMKERE
jgi:hypothetical protein